MKVRVSKRGLDWYAETDQEVICTFSWHAAMQAAWGLVMFP